MRTPLQDKRLLRLQHFLEKLPAEKFDFGQEVSETEKRNEKLCPTVACAIGWTPSIFPRLVRWTWGADNKGDFYKFLYKGAHIGYRELALELFGIPKYHDIFYPNCARRNTGCTTVCGFDATPQDVARLIAEYRRLYPVTKSTSSNL